MGRLILVARLKRGARERARELVAAGPSNEPAPGSRHGTVLLTPTEVVFLFEGDDAEQRAREFFDDPLDVFPSKNGST